MRMLVTGASGFIGKYVVQEALRRGYQVRAAIGLTSRAALPWQGHPAVEVVNVDLRGDAEVVKGMDVVIHLAAVTGGSYDQQLAGTVTATETLLEAMQKAEVRRLVAISTFSVYDYLRCAPGTTIREESPLESVPQHRDVYAQTKLLQEQLVRHFEHQGGQVTILRPGIVYGRDRLWNAYLGAKARNLWLRIGTDAQVPLIYVENCAEAVVLAADSEAAIGKTINLVDDELPTQQEYAAKVMQHLPSKPRTISISWGAMNALAGTVDWCNRRLLGGRAKLPGILVPARLHARFKPLRYDNTQAKRTLNWQPQYALDSALERCSRAELG
ncbi:MAG: NAD-dependent epimerase/dehydratase family protein [Cyanophyceae cyanobacterium]